VNFAIFVKTAVIFALFNRDFRIGLTLVILFIELFLFLNFKFFELYNYGCAVRNNRHTEFYAARPSG